MRGTRNALRTHSLLCQGRNRRHLRPQQHLGNPISRRAGQSVSTFDSVIHNAAAGYREKKRIKTQDGLPHVFATNTLAPYILTVLIHRPKRLVYLSSGLHRDVNTRLEDMLWEKRKWQASEAYAGTKSHDVLLAFAVARHWRNPEIGRCLTLDRADDHF